MLYVGISAPIAQLGRYVGESGGDPVKNPPLEPVRHPGVGVETIGDTAGLPPEPSEREFRG